MSMLSPQLLGKGLLATLFLSWGYESVEVTLSKGALEAETEAGATGTTGSGLFGSSCQPQ